MQSNVDALRDDLQEFPDSWVELYNDASTQVNIYNWCIADQSDPTKGWRFKYSYVIPAKGYLVIYCDRVGSGKHTDFRLESGSGGNIYLFDASNNVVDQLTDIPPQREPNIAYGRINDANASWECFITPTPGKANTGPTSFKLPPKLEFNVQGGVFRAGFTLKISVPEYAQDEYSTSDIYYTTDGSEPTRQSKKYYGSMAISKTTIIRAKIIADGCLIGQSVTQSYIIETRNIDLPIVSISMNKEYLTDPDFGIYVKGSGKYGQSGNGVDEKVNWNNNWRRPMNIEYYPAQGEKQVINQLGELRIGGGWTRANAQKSLIIYSNKRFGEKHFDYPLFASKPDMKIKSFMLRNSGNDFWVTHFRDAALQQFMGGKVDLDYQEYKPAVLYINGEYYGIQNLRERSNEDFVYSNYDKLEDIDMVENWWECKAGDMTDFNDMHKKIQLTPTQIPYAEIMNMWDLNEIINYYILQIWVSNTDFPGNNVVLWKPREAGGKWRFITKDTDFGAGIWGRAVNENCFAHNNKREWGAYLFAALITQKSFKDEFCKRFALYMGDILQPDQTSHIIDSLQNNITNEMPFHLSRWRPYVWNQYMDGWNNEVKKMRDWCRARNSYVYSQLRSTYGFKNLASVVVETPEEVTGISRLEVNDINLYTRKFNGKYYVEHPFNITTTTASNSNFAGWEVTSYSSSGKVTTTLWGNQTKYTIPSTCTKLEFKALASTTALPPTEQQTNIITHADGITINGLTGESQITVTDTAGRVLKKTSTTETTAHIVIGTKEPLLVTVNSAGKQWTHKVMR